MVQISVFSVALSALALASVASAQTCKAGLTQCGGSAYTGVKTCCSGFTCKVVSSWYSQCQASTGTSPIVSPPPTSPIVSTGTAYVAPDQGSATGNPYQGVPRFVPSDYAKKVDSSIAKYTGNSTRIAKLNKLKTYPTASWLDTMSAIGNLKRWLDEAGAQGKGKDIIAEIVVYDLPGRDCAAAASNGEIPKGGIETYKTQYIDKIVPIMAAKPSNVILSIILEPDSLPNIATNLGQVRCDETSTKEYHEGIAYAIAKLSVLPRTHVYLDAGHGGWLGWPDNQQKIVPIFKKALDDAKALNPQAKLRGFGSAIANYSVWKGNGACPAKEKCPIKDGKYDWNECIDEDLYTKALNKVFEPAGLPTRWVVDTSRSGRNTIRQYWGSWCNCKGAGIGERPVTNPASHVDALVWIKPPGDSDGTSQKGAARLDAKCDPTDSSVSLGASGSDALTDAPEAGQWFEKQLIMLVDNANPAL